MGNSGILDNSLIQDTVKSLAAKLPSGWRIDSALSPTKYPKVDALLRIRGPGSQIASVLVEAKPRVEPRDLDAVSATLKSLQQPVILVAPFLSPRTQERLRALGIAYADLTGNIRLSLSEPGLYIETRGADKNPEPSVRERRSLKGAKAGRLIRALCDFRPPMGLRELAKRAGVDAGYASRIVDFLDREALVVRAPRGPITTIDWPSLLRRWSQEYAPLQQTRVTWYLSARGISPLIEKLGRVSMLYAVTGSWAAAQFAPVAAPKLLMCYAEDAANLATALDLRPSDAGSNVALLSAFDPVVYERTMRQKGILITALTQVAADLLTSPGRGPNEAQALMDWMQENENVWRT